MKRYFRHEAESDLGDGVAYLEITDEWPTRQVEVYGDAWRWADENHADGLADQPLSQLGLKPQHEIEAGEFERVWQEAHRRCPPVS